MKIREREREREEGAPVSMVFTGRRVASRLTPPSSRW